MYVQWCLKGIPSGNQGITDGQVKLMLDAGGGIVSNWLRLDPRGYIGINEIVGKLTLDNLLRHVNDYDGSEPMTGQPVSQVTPFISFTAGTIERRKFLATNNAIPAHQTALRFATDSGKREGYIFWAWQVITLNEAVPVQQVGEEVRSLVTYRDYSKWNLEGEVTAKVWLPSTQIERCEKYGSRNQRFQLLDVFFNPNYQPPDPVLNYRDVI